MTLKKIDCFDTSGGLPGDVAAVSPAVFVDAQFEQPVEQADCDNGGEQALLVRLSATVANELECIHYSCVHEACVDWRVLQCPK